MPSASARQRGDFANIPLGCLFGPAAPRGAIVQTAWLGRRDAAVGLHASTRIGETVHSQPTMIRYRFFAFFCTVSTASYMAACGSESEGSNGPGAPASSSVPSPGVAPGAGAGTPIQPATGANDGTSAGNPAAPATSGAERPVAVDSELQPNPTPANGGSANGAPQTPPSEPPPQNMEPGQQPVDQVPDGLVTATIRIDDPVPGWASEEGGTTGGGTDLGSAVTVSTTSELEGALAGGGIILVQPGEYDFTLARVEDDGMRPQSNTTIIGTAPGVIINGGIQIRGQNNIIVRNVQVKGEFCATFDECRAGQDAFLVADDSHHVWVDHVDVVDGQDGNFDIVRGADFVTASFCQFRYTRDDKPHAFSNLMAGSDGEVQNRGKLRITYMLSWWGRGVQERQPRGRFGKVHVFNNYYDTERTDGYLIGPGVEIQMVVENNQMDVSPVVPAFTESFEEGSAAYRATGNEGTAGAPLNKAKGEVFQVPYEYTLLRAADVQGVVTATSGGAGTTVTLER
jgi:pectate lyase